MNEYSTEKFIYQYEHISKLELLTSAELNQLKKKRAQFEVSMKNTTNPKPFIEYIKFELVLIKKFQQNDNQKYRDQRALERVLIRNVKEIFLIALRKFKDKRKLWSLYISFAKSKVPNMVSGIYQEMLNFHNTKEDYIEVIEYEISKKNFNTALSLTLQAIGREKDPKELVALHIRCSLQQAYEQGDEIFKNRTIQQVSKLYTKFLKESEDITIHINLLNNIQNFHFSMEFQNQILLNLIEKFTAQARTWDLLAKRHLDGLFFNNEESENGKDKSDEEKNVPKDIPIEMKLKHALAIYDKAFEIIGKSNTKEMYELYIEKLLELDEGTDMNDFCQRQLRHALGKAFLNGYNEDKLSELHFIYLLRLRILYRENHRNDIDEMFDKGMKLYPKSVEFYELAIKYFIEEKNYDSVAKIFKHAIAVNEKNAIELYKFLCEIYLKNPTDKDKARAAMMEAINSNDKKLSGSFQPYVIEYYAHTEGIKKAREIYASLLKSKTVTSLSLDFYKTMIKLEQQQTQPDNKIIVNCFERGIDGFGKEDPEIWIEYIKHFWNQNKFNEANSLRKRAIEMMKRDVGKINEFEMKFTLFRNESGTDADANE